MKNFERFFKCSQKKTSSAMMKLALMRTATGKEDPELPLLQRISSLELTAPQIAAQINASQSSSNRRISTSTVQKRLRESGLHGRIAVLAVTPQEPPQFLVHPLHLPVRLSLVPGTEADRDPQLLHEGFPYL